MVDKVKIKEESDLSEESIEGEEESEKSIFSKNLLNTLRLTALKGYTIKSLETDSDTESEEPSKSEDDESSGEPTAGDQESSVDEIRTPARKYIENTVGEPLLFALVTLERERPDNPIEFIAEYLLYYQSRAEQEKRNKDEASKSSNPLAYYVQPKIKDRL